MRSDPISLCLILSYKAENGVFSQGFIALGSEKYLFFWLISTLPFILPM